MCGVTFRAGSKDWWTYHDILVGGRVERVDSQGRDSQNNGGCDPKCNADGLALADNSRGNLLVRIGHSDRLDARTRCVVRAKANDVRPVGPSLGTKLRLLR